MFVRSLRGVCEVFVRYQSYLSADEKYQTSQYKPSYVVHLVISRDSC